ncbi:hypothetical protein Mgra_00001581 [Meloidogyne graminicola]|uniref:Uncharacterized protein n=1 Tax=Meloidogyne graminicola TaxID=189291 RepID=A0A8T0A0W9_9BILA|nr:hypothetical protein Mgra_00001581 [Meloidogyne graminicola]
MTDPRESSLARATWTINTSVDQIGTVLFSCLIITTIKQKRLHHNCQILIGIYAFCSLLSKIQILLPFFVFILPGSGKIPRIYCAIVQIIPIGGCLNVFTLMLIIGIDRMIGMFFPICKIQCFFQDLVGNDGQNILVTSQLVFNCLTLGCYILMLFKLIYDQRTGKICAQRKAVYKTLALIMGIQIGGYMFTLIAYDIFNQISSNFTNEQSQIITCIINVISSLSSTIEVPAIYAVSTEHRLAIKDEFNWFFRIFSNKNNIKVFTLTNKNTLKTLQPQLNNTKTNGIVSSTIIK